MPRDPGDREAIEAALHPEHLVALVDACGRLGIPVECWHHVPAVRGFFELLAFACAVEALEATEGGTAERIRESAALRLGLNGETLDRALRRARKAAWQRR